MTTLEKVAAALREEEAVLAEVWKQHQSSDSFRRQLLTLIAKEQARMLRNIAVRLDAIAREEAHEAGR